MIHWEDIHKSLKAHCIYLIDPTLKEVLNYLYNEEKLSVRILIKLMNDMNLECSTCSLRAKMKELGIKMRGKGGPNYIKPFEITKEEYKQSSYKEMAFKHNVNITTIRNRCKQFIKTNGKKRRL